MRAKNAGFSLTELMVALLLLSILVGVAVPAFGDMMRRQRLTSNANETLVMLQYARSEAIKRQTNIEVSFIEDSTGWTIEVRHGDTDELLRTLSKTDSQTSWDEELTVVFDLRGRPTAAACAELNLNDAASLSRQINVFSGGKISVQDGSCG